VKAELETTAWYALGIPLFAAVIALEVFVGRRRGTRWVSFAETLSNLSAGLGTLVIGLFVGPLVLRLYEYGYSLRVVDWRGSAWCWPFALLLSDLCYYAHHRAGHRFAILWSIHGVHHQHEHLASSVGLRLEWLADLSTVVFFSAMPLLGVDSTTGFAAIAALSLYALTTHSPMMARPSFGIFVTPATHGAHHSRDGRYADKNFAAMFTFWDRLLGTYAKPEGDLAKDVPTICRAYDGVGAQFVLVAELVRRLGRETRWRDRVRVAFARPELASPPRVPRDEALLSSRARAYLLADFLATALLGTWVLWMRGPGERWVAPAIAALVIWGLRTNGQLLDGRPRAAREHALRLVVALALSAALAAVHGVVAGAIAAGALALASAALLLDAGRMVHAHVEEIGGRDDARTGRGPLGGGP
jgi:sterol desaturase/sphingolipid hydroxylase (fatty acid hydroxylase superfamily)